MKEISVATIRDIPDLCDLLFLLFSQEDEFIPNKSMQEQGLKIIIENPSVGHILVVKKENKIVGMITILYTVSTALGGMVGILEDMIVHPNYRSSGIGNKLMEYSLEFAKNQNLKRLTLLTDESNIAAHTFYKKHNFSKSSMTPFRKFI
ncbi:MAG: GNAT family N-acetyltransferase [Sulfurovaceae bacterium]|nr:GNAT family N-acetyltransferase [Sulfurovaceae bacterium]MDD5549020.1 GNAT family N-acetyltransferase [Sulfurovaceae bacterium]